MSPIATPAAILPLSYASSGSLAPKAWPTNVVAATAKENPGKKDRDFRKTSCHTQEGNSVNKYNVYIATHKYLLKLQITFDKLELNLLY